MASSAGTRRASDAERFRLSTEQIRKLGDKAAEAKMLAYCEQLQSFHQSTNPPG